MKRRITFLVTLVLLTTASLLNAAGVVLTKKTPSQAEEYWSPVEFGSVENFPTSVVITSQETKQTTTIPRHQIGVVIEFLDFNSISILNEDGINKVKAERDSVARHAGKCKPAAGILSVVVRNYDQVLGYYAEGNVLIAGKWLKKHDYEAKQKADALAATAGAIPEVVSGGKSFKNVRVTKVNGDRISVMHDGGVASFSVADLSEEMRMKLEIAFPKYFKKANPNLSHPSPSHSSEYATNGNVNTSKNTNKSAVAEALPTMPSGSGILPPSPLEPSITQPLQPLTPQSKWIHTPPNAASLDREKDRIGAAVESIRKRLAAIDTSRDIDFLFDFASGKMSFLDQKFFDSGYAFMLGDLDPERIYVGKEYDSGGNSKTFVQAFAHDDETLIDYKLGENSWNHRLIKLEPNDPVDTRKIAEALTFLVKTYQGTPVINEDDPVTQMTKLLSKMGFNIVVTDKNGFLEFRASSKFPKIDSVVTTTRVLIADLDPEKFSGSGGVDPEALYRVTMKCISGKQSTVITEFRGERTLQESPTIQFEAVNKRDAEKILEHAMRICIRAGWKRSEF